MDTFEDNINSIVNDLIDDYHKGKEIDKTRIFNHPNKEVIIDILSSLRKVIFPGYFKNGMAHDEVIWTELKSTITITGDTESVEQFCQVRCIKFYYID